MKNPKNLMQLEQVISTGDWPVGTRLPAERQLAALLGCSRAALREKLQALRCKGLIQSKRGAGSVVSKASPSPLLALLSRSPRSRQELLAVRSALDGMAAQGAAELASDRELAAIRRQHRHFSKAVNQCDQVKMNHFDTEFHLAIASASHNKVLLEIVRNLREELQTSIEISSDRLFGESDFSKTVLEQHQNIIAAIGRRDATAARSAAERHTQDIAKRLNAIQPL